MNRIRQDLGLGTICGVAVEGESCICRNIYIVNLLIVFFHSLYKRVIVTFDGLIIYAGFNLIPYHLYLVDFGIKCDIFRFRQMHHINLAGNQRGFGKSNPKSYTRI